MRVLLCWCLVRMRREENSIFRKICLKKMLWIPLTSLVSVATRGRLWILGCCGVSKTISESSWQVSKPQLFKTSVMTWIHEYKSTFEKTFPVCSNTRLSSQTFGLVVRPTFIPIPSLAWDPTLLLSPTASVSEELGVCSTWNWVLGWKTLICMQAEWTVLSEVLVLLLFNV